MRVVVTEPYTSGKQTMTLEQALQPAYDSSHGEGQLETLEGRCRRLEEVLGRLLVALVDRRKLSLESAAIIAGNRFSSIMPVED